MIKFKPTYNKIIITKTRKSKKYPQPNKVYLPPVNQEASFPFLDGKIFPIEPKIQECLYLRLLFIIKLNV